MKKLFWQDIKLWKSASQNTLHCLVGCSMGDFGMLIFLQAYYPNTSLWVQMFLAIVTGLCTSIILETILLKIKKYFGWRKAFLVAFSMSFMSMIAMEIVMNITDFMITGGKGGFQKCVLLDCICISSDNRFCRSSTL